MLDAKDAGSDRDEVVSGFTRLKIKEWKDGGRELQELARIATIGKSSPSQAIRGTGIGKKTLKGYARAFGYPSVDAYRAAAWEWWQAEGRLAATVDHPHTPEQDRAIATVLSLGQGTAAQVETILQAYSHPRFRDRDAGWWTQTLLAELARDRETLRTDQAHREEINETQRAVRAVNDARKPVPPVPQTPGAKRRAG